jgi:hypothetical protein
VAKRVSGIYGNYIRRHHSRRNCTLSMSKMWEGNGNDSDEDCNEDETGDCGSVKDLVSSLIKGAIHGEITGGNNERSNEHTKAFFKLLKEV